MRKLLVLPLAALALAAAPAGAQAPTGVAVAGKVTDAVSGVPVVGASVLFGRSRRTVWTDDQGRFVLTPVEPGAEWLTIEQLGYADGQLAVAVAEGMPPLSVTLQPDPVLLKGLAVVAQRLMSRPGAFAMGMHALDAHDLQRPGPWNVAEVLRYRGGIFPVSCYSAFGTVASIGAATAATCVWSRGQYEPTRVFLDDMELYGGLEALAGIPVSEVYRIEIYEHGAFIQVLTKQWARRAAERGGRSDLPAFF